MKQETTIEKDNGVSVPHPATIDADPVRAGLQHLAQRFPAGAYGKLFKAFKKDEAKAAPRRHCTECGSTHSTAPGIHLDYIGHANVTDRLLSVDPRWTWEPLAFDEGGLPRFLIVDGHAVGLWIKLTVLGVTRLGFGSVEAGAFDSEKQLIGDAIRNAAMRFGVALELWSKTELESTSLATSVDKATGEIREKPKPIQDERKPSETPIEERATAVFGAVPCEVAGVPITIKERFADFARETIGGKGKYKDAQYADLLDSDDGREYLEYMVDWSFKEHGKGVKVGPKIQKLLLAYDELQSRISASPVAPLDDGAPWAE